MTFLESCSPILNLYKLKSIYLSLEGSHFVQIKKIECNKFYKSLYEIRNKIYTKNTEYIACRQNLSKNLHFHKTFVYLSVVAKSAPLLSPQRSRGLHPLLVPPLRGLRTTSRFAKSQERKQTSFSGLRKSAEPLHAIL